MAEAAAPSSSEQRDEAKPRYVINEIPRSQWPDGVPAVMGAHLMESGQVAPLSTSKGPGEGNVPHMFQYHTDETDTHVCQYADFNAAARGMVAQVASLSAKAIEERGAFVLAISGGSMLKALGEFKQAKDVDFSKWWVTFVDERNVPHSSDDSTYKGAKGPFLDALPIPAEQVRAQMCFTAHLNVIRSDATQRCRRYCNILTTVKISSPWGRSDRSKSTRQPPRRAAQVLEIHEGLTAEQAATNYEGRMLDVPPSTLPRDDSGMPVLDCILLGTGPDGHIASLFPNHPALAVKEGWILPITDSPKPPPERITFTLPAINAAKAVLFLACGSGKAEVVHRALECQALPGAIPAQLVRPASGTVTWLLDLESSAQLEIASWDDKKAHPRSQV